MQSLTTLRWFVICCATLRFVWQVIGNVSVRGLRMKQSGASDAQLLAFAQVLSHVRVGEGAHPWVGGLLGLPVLAIRSTSRGAMSGLAWLWLL